MLVWLEYVGSNNNEHTYNVLQHFISKDENIVISFKENNRMRAWYSTLNWINSYDKQKLISLLKLNWQPCNTIDKRFPSQFRTIWQQLSSVNPTKIEVSHWKLFSVTKWWPDGSCDMYHISYKINRTYKFYRSFYQFWPRIIFFVQSSVWVSSSEKHLKIK